MQKLSKIETYIRTFSQGSHAHSALQENDMFTSHVQQQTQNMSISACQESIQVFKNIHCCHSSFSPLRKLIFLSQGEKIHGFKVMQTHNPSVSHAKVAGLISGSAGVFILKKSVADITFAIEERCSTRTISFFSPPTQHIYFLLHHLWCDTKRTTK